MLLNLIYMHWYKHTHIPPQIFFSKHDRQNLSQAMISLSIKA